MTALGGYWRWNTGHRSSLASLKLKKNNIHRDKESFIVRGCARQQCRATRNRSKRTEAKRLVSSSCVLAVCRLTLCMSPPTVPDCVLHMWAWESDITNMKVDQRVKRPYPCSLTLITPKFAFFIVHPARSKLPVGPKFIRSMFDPWLLKSLSVQPPRQGP